MFKHMAYIMAFISLLVVVLSIYSTISLDATTKQKEIAIRKINGARKGDILRRFVAPYVVTFAVTFLAVYPPMATFYWKNSGAYSSAMGVEFIVIYGAGVFFGILAMLAIITWYRIRMIMSVNPAEVIRRE
jgi:ABC-type lipoprotein release transport system permease subunit